MTPGKRKRENVRVACNACRAKKARCDGQRPTCGKCAATGIQCVFDTVDPAETRRVALLRHLETVEEQKNEGDTVLSKLLYGPEDESIELLRNLRRKAGKTSALRPAMTGHLDEQVSSGSGETSHSAQSGHDVFQANSRERPAHEGARSIAHAFALLHREPYDKVIQLLRYVTSSQDSRFSLAAISQMLEAAIEPQSAPEHLIISTHLAPSIALQLPQNGLEYELMMCYPIAYPMSEPLDCNAPEIACLAQSRMKTEDKPGGISNFPSESFLYCDDRLHNLDVSHWTTVPITNHQAASMISLYLEMDHVLLGFFDADLFVEDLVNHANNFCSSFLVNAVLSVGSQAYSTFNLGCHFFSQAFLMEASEQWKLSGTEDSILNLAASQVLCFYCLCNCTDDLGEDLRLSGQKMGERLKLFGITNPKEEISKRGKKSKISFRAISYVAWGCFNWFVLIGQHFGHQPPQNPPPYPIPGDGSGPSEQALYTGQIFSRICEFRRICVDMVVCYNSNSRHPQDIPLTFAETRYQCLLQWAASLAASETTKTHHVAILHIWLHIAILDTFRPFLGRGLRLSTFYSANSTPEAVFTASLKQLKSLSVQYQKENPLRSCCILWHLSLLYIANAVLHNACETDLRFHFFASIYGYQELSRAFSIAGGILKGLLYMALERKFINRDTARDVLDGLYENHSQYARFEFTSGYKLDLEKALTDPEKALVSVLSSKMGEMEMNNGVRTPDEGGLVQDVNEPSHSGQFDELFGDILNSSALG